MKTSIKIIILVSALTVVIGLLLFFFRSISAPPSSDPISGQHVEDINMNIADINDEISASSLENTFLSTDRKIALWAENSLIGTWEHDECIQTFLENYIQTYVSQTESRLSQKSWGKSDRDDIVSRICYLREEKLSDGQGVVASTDNNMSSKLYELEKICNDYTAASSFVAKTSFVSLSDSKTRVQKARDYAEDSYLSNSDLSSSLNNFPEKLGDSHYRTLSALLNQLSDWRYVSLSTTEGNFKKFNTACDDYRNTTIYGGSHPKSVSDMKSQAKRYMDNAYDEKCSLTVDNKSYDMSYTYNAAGGYSTFSVYTNHPDGYDVSLPSFCSLSSKSSSSFKIYLNENTSGSSRSGQIKVTAGNKSIKVSVKQKEPEKESVSISSVTMDHNVTQNGEKGMRINVSYSASHLSGNGLHICAWFYFQNGNVLKDYNNSYATTNGQVTVQKWTYSTNSYQTVTLFIPYSELHCSNRGTYDLKFFIGINDSNDKRLTSSSYYDFQLTNS